jgi:hypothetical protein
MENSRKQLIQIMVQQPRSKQKLCECPVTLKSCDMCPYGQFLDTISRTEPCQPKSRIEWAKNEMKRYNKIENWKRLKQ